MVPMNRVRTGAAWRSLPDQLCRAESIDPNLNQNTRLMPMNCYRSSANSTGQRGMTTYRQARHVNANKDGQYKVNLFATKPDGTQQVFCTVLPPQVGHASSCVYVVFEIMDDGLPHEIPYLGCPTVGTFENFSLASSLAVAFEWFDESSNEWKKSYINLMGYRTKFHRGVETSDVMKSLGSWRYCMDLIQLLEGIDYTGPLNGFHQSLHLTTTDVKELEVDHLNQKVSWRTRTRRSRPAPKLALFEDNARLLGSMVRNMRTITNMKDPPPLSSDFWRPSENDANAIEKSPLRCDFCRYMDTKDKSAKPCERDSRITDRWVCKCCALMHRPCTWTARTHALEYWGTGEPYLTRGEEITACPTGPHRLLAFHRTIPGRMKTVEVAEPLEGLRGLEILRSAEVGVNDEDGLDGDGNAADDDLEDED